MKRATNVQIHKFYCLNCGNCLPLARKSSIQRERFHRKKLYCPFCNLTINMVECKNDFDKMEFMNDFNLGKFKEEAKESIEKENFNVSI